MVGQYTMTLWMPQLIQRHIQQIFEYDHRNAGGRSSDKRLERRYHAAIPIAIGAASFALLGKATTSSVLLSITLWSLTASAINGLMGPFWSLPNEFLTGYSAAAGIAFINCFGNLGGFV